MSAKLAIAIFLAAAPLSAAPVDVYNNPSSQSGSTDTLSGLSTDCVQIPGTSGTLGSTFKSGCGTLSTNINGGIIDLATTFGSTIISNGNSITFSTDTTASGTGTQNFLFTNKGYFFSKAGIDPTLISTQAKSAATQNFFFAAGISTGSAPNNRQFALGVTGSSGPDLMLLSANSNGSMVGPSFTMYTASGTLLNPATPVTAANNLAIGTWQAIVSSGTTGNTLGSINWQLDASGINTDASVTGPVSYPTNLIFKTSRPNTAVAVEGCRMTSTGTFACGITSGIVATRLETGSYNDATGVVQSTGVVFQGNSTNNPNRSNTGVYIGQTMGTGICSTCTQTALFVENNNASVSDSAGINNAEISYLLQMKAAYNSVVTPLVFGAHGNLGVGTYQPQAKVHISSGSNVLETNQLSTPNTSLYIDGNASTSLQVGVSSLTLTPTALTLWGSTATIGANGAISVPVNPHASCYTASNTVLKAATVTNLFWVSSRDVTQNVWAAGPTGSSDTFRATVAGTYRLMCQCGFAASTADNVRVRISNPNGAPTTIDGYSVTNASFETSAHAEWEDVLTVGSTMVCQVYANNAAETLAAGDCFATWTKVK